MATSEAGQLQVEIAMIKAKADIAVAALNNCNFQILGDSSARANLIKVIKDAQATLK